MTGLHCQVESTCAIAVVRLVGALEVASAGQIWNCVAKRLADQPDALIVDVSGLHVDDSRALSVFGAVARRASIWPGIATILCEPSAALFGALHDYSINQAVTICRTRDEAMLLASGAPVPLRLRETMAPIMGAARQGRDLATEACLRWRIPTLVPRASVVSSELVTNAVRHTGQPFDLSLARTLRYLHIAVHDRSSEPALRRDADPLAPSGRGLLIVERTSMRWGCTLTDTGKVVWATLRAE
jgi:anti-anti-sigma regulatory factor